MVLFTIHKTYIYLLIYTVTIFSISLSFFNQKRTFFLITWPWTLTYDLDLTSELDRVMSRWTIVPNIYASKAISFWSYCPNTHTHMHSGPTALPGPLNWSVWQFAWHSVRLTVEDYHPALPSNPLKHWTRQNCIQLLIASESWLWQSGGGLRSVHTAVTAHTRCSVQTR